MRPARLLNDWAAGWIEWAAGSLVDGSVALLVVGLVWLAFGRRLQPRLGAWLFALVLLKCALPLPVLVPILGEAMPAAWSTPHENVAPPMLGETAPETIAPHITMAPDESPRSTEALSVASWLLLAWLAGIVVQLARMGWLWRRTQCLIRQARLVSVGDVEGLPSLAERSGGPHAWTVRISKELRSPAVAGWLRPVLLLPEGLQERLRPEQYRWVLAHELAHLRARDVAWQWTEALLRTLVFFHPAAWLASAQSSRLRERACDEAAVRLSGASRQASAEGFVSLIEWAHQPVVFAGLSLGRAGREARSRVRDLTRGPWRQIGPRWQAGLAILCLGLALPSFRAGYAQQQQPKATPEKARIVELEKRVADLERQLQAKSRLETLRENAVRRAHERVQADDGKFTPEQLLEIERVYQEAKKVGAADQRAIAFQPLFDRYPAANRTGCAVILLANMMQPGSEREALLHKAVKSHNDAYFLDGTSVGGVARLMLAQDAQAAGRAADAKKWRDEIRRQYPDELDFGAVPLVDILDQPAGRP